MVYIKFLENAFNALLFIELFLILTCFDISIWLMSNGV